MQTVRSNGAAERAGVREGDVIVKVDGRRVTEALHTDVVALIQGNHRISNVANEFLRVSRVEKRSSYSKESTFA